MHRLLLSGEQTSLKICTFHVNGVDLQLARLVEPCFWRIHGLFFDPSTGRVYRWRTSCNLVHIYAPLLKFDSNLTAFCYRSLKVRHSDYNFHAHAYSMPKTSRFLRH